MDSQGDVSTSSDAGNPGLDYDGDSERSAATSTGTQSLAPPDIPLIVTSDQEEEEAKEDVSRRQSAVGSWVRDQDKTNPFTRVEEEEKNGDVLARPAAPRARRITVHRCTDFRELEVPESSTTTTTATTTAGQLPSSYHSCSVIDDDLEPFDSDKLYMHARRKWNSYSSDDLRRSDIISGGGEAGGEAGGGHQETTTTKMTRSRRSGSCRSLGVGDAHHASAERLPSTTSRTNLEVSDDSRWSRSLESLMRSEEGKRSPIGSSMEAHASSDSMQLSSTSNEQLSPSGEHLSAASSGSIPTNNVGGGGGGGTSATLAQFTSGSIFRSLDDEAAVNAAAAADQPSDGHRKLSEERSTRSDPAAVGADDRYFPAAHGQPATLLGPHTQGNLPSFSFNVTSAEDLAILRHLRSKRLYGSSYRGLLSRDRRPVIRDNSDKDSVETGSISTMQTVRFDLLDETPAWRIGAEVVLPFLLAGLGMIGAGLLLDRIQHWDVFNHVSEVFILVPALLGLKGNLEMTLASRLSTQANLGNMDSAVEQWKMIGGNLALTQAQAIVVGFLAAVAAMTLGWIPEGKFDINHGFLLCCSSVLTAAFASFVLGTIMILVVLLSRKCHINPDNVATPIAASLGDLTTLALLSGISSLMYKAIDKNQLWLAPTLLFIFLALTPLWCVVSHRNKYTREILYTGWTPVIGAMVISSVGGLILDFAVGSYHGIAVFQPVINGVGGNLVAVQASRLSTALHRVSTPGNLPEGSVTGCPNVISTFFGSGVNARTARVLLLLVVPGHLIFMYTIHYMQAGHTSITLIFAVVYLSACCIQVLFLLYIANWLVHWLWRRGNDPDNFSIPYLTALGDLLGTGLLAGSFHLLYVIGDRDADVGD